METEKENYWICPACGAEINKLRYSVPATEYGNCYLGKNPNNTAYGEEYDSNDSDSDGDYVYSCPDCGEDIDMEDLELAEGSEENKEEKKEDGKNIIEEPSITSHEVIKTHPSSYHKIAKYKCKNCQEIIYEKLNSTRCSNCGEDDLESICP